jgi:hypothetical protein
MRTVGEMVDGFVASMARDAWTVSQHYMVNMDILIEREKAYSETYMLGYNRTAADAKIAEQILGADRLASIG